MEISIHLKADGTLTNARVMSLATGLSYLPHTVRLRPREETPGKVDLIIQTGFASSECLREAIGRRIPYLIMEGPIFRDMYDKGTVSDFTYNGLQAGGTRPAPKSEPRPHPEILPMHTEGSTLILGQKPTDMSLRGQDHIQWIKDKRHEYPDAEFRHNPIMVPAGYYEPIKEALVGVARTISYTSTASVESVFSGCETICEHPANEAYSVNGDREEWAHRLSWMQFTHEELEDPDVAAYILTGYDEALENTRQGKVETPRPKVLGSALMSAYYAEFPYEAPGETLIEKQRREQ